MIEEQINIVPDYLRILTWACLIAATGMDAAGACGGGGRAAGGGTGGAGAAGVGGGGGGGGGAAALGAAGVGAGAAGVGAGAAGFGAGAAAGAAPPVAPISMVHIFCPGFTTSPSFTKTSLRTPAPGAGTGIEVYAEHRRLNPAIAKQP